MTTQPLNNVKSLNKCDFCQQQGCKIARSCFCLVRTGKKARSTPAECIGGKQATLDHWGPESVIGGIDSDSD